MPKIPVRVLINILPPALKEEYKRECMAYYNEDEYKNTVLLYEAKNPGDMILSVLVLSYTERGAAYWRIVAERLMLIWNQPHNQKIIQEYFEKQTHT